MKTLNNNPSFAKENILNKLITKETCIFYAFLPNKTWCFLAKRHHVLFFFATQKPFFLFVFPVLALAEKKHKHRAGQPTSWFFSLSPRLGSKGLGGLGSGRRAKGFAAGKEVGQWVGAKKDMFIGL